VQHEAVIATRSAYEADAATWASRRQDRTYWSARVASFAEAVRKSGVPGPVLDLGCGPGVGTAELAAAGLEVVGLDVTRAMLEIAITQPGVRDLVQGDSRLLPLAGGGFAAVWASASLLHLPKSQAGPALAEVARVLRRGGCFYSSMKEGDREGLDSPGAASDVKGSRYFAHYRRQEWPEKLAGAGFSVLEQHIEADARAGYPDWIVTVAVKL
jgi:SAM-dependent methyltransferase